MTNYDVMQIVPIIGALPMGDLTYSPALMLLHTNLQQINAEIEEQRRTLITDARKGAEVPDDFDERLSKYEERRKNAAAEERMPEAEGDAEFVEIYNKVIGLFSPAWAELMGQEAKLRFKLLTPEQFAALYAAVKAGPAELTVGAEKIPADIALTAVAGLLVA